MNITIRPLRPDDLEAVVAIDRAGSGASRRGYFEKRLAAAQERPGDFVYVALETGGRLTGYALAKLTRGEFGKPGAGAALDAIGVDPAHGHRGQGRALLAEVERVLAAKGVETLTSQVAWGDRAMLGFFAGAGFTLAPRTVLIRDTAIIPPRLPPEREDRWDEEPDFSSPDGDDPDALSHDPFPVRAMRPSDLDRIVTIDRANSGTDRRDYLSRKMRESLHDSGVRVSLIAETDGIVAGFIMARVDFGEFGHTVTEAEMDTLGVDPALAGHGIGRVLMSELISGLRALQVDFLRTEIDWNDTGMIGYLDHLGFRPAQRLVLERRLPGTAP